MDHGGGLDGWVSGGSIAERWRLPWPQRGRETPAPNLPVTAKLTHTCYKKGPENHTDDISGLYNVGMGASLGGDPTLMDGVETGNAPGPDSSVRQQRRRSLALMGRSRLVSRVLSPERSASFSMRRPSGRWGVSTQVWGYPGRPSQPRRPWARQGRRYESRGTAGTPKQFQALYGLPGRENLFCPGQEGAEAPDWSIFRHAT